MRASPPRGAYSRAGGISSSTRRACSSASSSSQAETERHPKWRANRAHRRACSWLARTVKVAILRLAPRLGGVMQPPPRPEGVAELLRRAVERPEDLDQVREGGTHMPILEAAQHGNRDPRPPRDLLHQEVLVKP